MNTAPFLVSFSSVDEYLAALDDSHKLLHEADIRRLCELGLPPVVSASSLGVLFGFTAKFIHAMSDQSYKFYRTFKIKKGKKIRSIEAPKVSIKVIQKWFAHHLAAAINFEENVCGFVPGRSHITAAMQHSNANWVYSVDIKDFFQTTTLEKVILSLEDMGYTKPGAEIIAQLCCYKGNLAQGAPSSPVLSNLAMKSIDNEIRNISSEYNTRFTRYADDIVLSGTDEIPIDLPERVKLVFDNTCWSLAPEKEYQAKSPNRLKVHGLLVHMDKPRLTKGYRNKIRSYKHLLENDKVKAEDIARLTGHIKYAESIDNAGE